MEYGKTIRLIFPEWQGGNMPLYPFGTLLMTLIVPETNSPQFQIDVPPYNPNTPPPDDGMLYRHAITHQIKEALALLDREQPDNIVTIGGDCLTSQAPFSWLNEKYNGQLGVLWIDAHPDVKTNKDTEDAFTYVLGDLLGEGDPGLASLVKVPLNPRRVMYAGVVEERFTEQEAEVVNRLGLRNAGPKEVTQSRASILQWIKEENIQKLAVHLDLDVFDPAKFRSNLFAEVDPQVDWAAIYAVGELNLETVGNILYEVSNATNLVAFTIAEHLPWDSWNLKKLLAPVPILNN